MTSLTSIGAQYVPASFISINANIPVVHPNPIEKRHDQKHRILSFILTVPQVMPACRLSI
jgi:hypothetical protein